MRLAGIQAKYHLLGNESEDWLGGFRREPLGIIAAITSCNDPLNLVAQELGRAFAIGNVAIVKPSGYTPLSAIKLVNYLMTAGLPSEVITVATGGAASIEVLVSSRDVRMVSFAGELGGGEQVAGASGFKKLTTD